MLVTGRTEGQSLKVGTDIVVTVTRVRAGTAHLGVAAPPGVPIVRTEVAERDEFLRSLGGGSKEAVPASPPGSRHAAEISKLRSAIHLVLARGQRPNATLGASDDVVVARFTGAEWDRIKGALAPGKEGACSC